MPDRSLASRPKTSAAPENPAPRARRNIAREVALALAPARRQLVDQVARALVDRRVDPRQRARRLSQAARSSTTESYYGLSVDGTQSRAPR